jgi:hypothetical protein
MALDIRIAGRYRLGRKIGEPCCPGLALPSAMQWAVDSH